MCHWEFLWKVRRHRVEFPNPEGPDWRQVIPLHIAVKTGCLRAVKVRTRAIICAANFA